jgi:hypothetical protein
MLGEIYNTLKDILIEFIIIDSVLSGLYDSPQSRSRVYPTAAAPRLIRTQDTRPAIDGDPNQSVLPHQGRMPQNGATT